MLGKEIVGWSVCVAWLARGLPSSCARTDCADKVQVELKVIILIVAFHILQDAGKFAYKPRQSLVRADGKRKYTTLIVLLKSLWTARSGQGFTQPTFKSLSAMSAQRCEVSGTILQYFERTLEHIPAWTPQEVV